MIQLLRTTLGTSPRMRGKPTTPRTPPTPPRNIPAYAGKTSRDHRLRGRRMEHPRVCGENLLTPQFFHGQVGTSPRMRGKLMLSFQSVAAGGNIPAYAGKTAPLPIHRLPPSGTSPRMRGKPKSCRSLRPQKRNIPAYAGKTHPDLGLCSQIQEHPRVCGENQRP